MHSLAGRALRPCSKIEGDHVTEPNRDDRSALSRRRFVAASGGAAIAAAMFAANRGSAQDSATPEATPAGAGDQSTGGTYLVNPPGHVATSLGPATPPEFDNPLNWPVQGKDLAQTRFYASGSTISTTTIDQLGLGWATAVDTGTGAIPLVANPIIVDGVVYLQDGASNVRAYNVETGELIWERRYDENVTQAGPNGIAIGYGFAVFGVGSSGTVIGLDAATGEDRWQVSLEGPLGEGIDMAPLIYDSTVYISTIPGGPNVSYRGGMRGFFYALDLSTGQTLWYFDTTTDNLWGNVRVNSGGGLWNPPAVDENGNLFLSVANAAPYPGTTDFPNASSRPGDNDYANSVLRINPATGGLDWYTNVKPHDIFDLDNQLSPILGVETINGVETKVVFTSGKHGLVVAMNAETGEVLWRTPVGKHQNDDLSEVPEGETLEVYPGNLGGVETPFAYANGVIFTALLNSPTYVTSTGNGEGPETLVTATGQIVAVNAADGSILWDVATPTPLFAAATVVNDVVFTGGLDGIVRGYNAANGEQVFTYQTASGLSAPLAIYGDYLLIPSGAPFIPSVDTWSPPPAPAIQLIALKIGGEVQVAPEAGATPEAETGASTSDGSSTDISLDAVDIAFSVSELSIPADTDVSITLTNQGVAAHDFVIDGTDFATPQLNGGESATIVVNLPAGTYTYYCSVPGHREAGMVGTLTVS